MDATKAVSHSRGGVSQRRDPAGSVSERRALAHAAGRDSAKQSAFDPSSTEAVARAAVSGGGECVGILLLDSVGKVVGASEEALRIAAGPPPRCGLNSLRDFCTATNSTRGENKRPSATPSWSAAFEVGDLSYRCRAVPLSLPRGSVPGHTVILLERVETRGKALSRLRAEFRLTTREVETIDLLAVGLTNKEIASRMGLSSNTVKAFLRSVMAKLRTSTRTGIIGALVTRMG